MFHATPAWAIIRTRITKLSWLALVTSAGVASASASVASIAARFAVTSRRAGGAEGRDDPFPAVAMSIIERRGKTDAYRPNALNSGAPEQALRTQQHDEQEKRKNQRQLVLRSE